MSSLKNVIFEYIQKTYHAEPEYLWRRFPGYAIFRHQDNAKWFALVMDVPAAKLGLRDRMDAEAGPRRFSEFSTEIFGNAEYMTREESGWTAHGIRDCGMVDILNVKMPDPMLTDLLIQQDGYMRGYHISRGNWISILLDGTVPFEDICRWIGESYMATASKETKQKLRAPKDWVIPANPAYYDVPAAFRRSKELDWKQGKGIKVGDTVYIYMGAPVSAILYRCRVIETDIPFYYDEGRVHMRAEMRLLLEQEYGPEEFTFERLGREFGIHAVRGPRGIPEALSTALREEGFRKC